MHTIHHLLTIKAAPAAVYAAITTPKGLNSWWTAQAEGQARLGEHYRFYFTDEYDWQGKVVAVHPDQLIRWEMTKADADWQGSELELALAEEEEGVTTLRLQHSNWKEVNDHFRRTSFCWAIYLNDLRRQVEQGVERPFSERVFV